MNLVTEVSCIPKEKHHEFCSFLFFLVILQADTRVSEAASEGSGRRMLSDWEVGNVRRMDSYHILIIKTGWGGVFNCPVVKREWDIL